MKKADLKSGMLIQVRSGAYGLVLIGTSRGDIIAKPSDLDDSSTFTWMPLNGLSEDMIHNNDVSGGDIMKIWEMPLENCFASGVNLSNRKLLWERK